MWQFLAGKKYAYNMKQLFQDKHIDNTTCMTFLKEINILIKSNHVMSKIVYCLNTCMA